MKRIASTIALSTALALAGCEDKLPPIPPRSVMTMTIAPVTNEMFGPFGGAVEARYETKLGFQASGRMIKRNVYVGDSVKKGQELASIDPTLAQFALIRAKADVANAKAQVENNQGTETRKQILAGTGASPQAALDTAAAGLATAKASLDQKLAALRSAEDGIGYTRLHANFDGVVTEWSAEIGQYVNDGQTVVTIARPDIREAVIDIPDSLISVVKPAMEFTVRLQSAPRITTKAKVREIGPLADTSTRSHRVRMTLEDPGDVFRIGTTITVEAVQTTAPKILLPSTAVFAVNEKHFVWVLAKDGKSVSRREIDAAPPDGDVEHIKSGLAAGDEVVIVGVHSLHDGEAVAGRVDDAKSQTDTNL